MMNKNKWMQQNYNNLKNKPINHIFLPGTHNSCAFKLNLNGNLKFKQKTFNFFFKLAKKSKFVKSIVHKWILTQKDSIYEQLNNGIRVLDLSISYNIDSKEYIISHTFPLIQLNDCLEQIKRFIEENKDEVIILFFKKDPD